MEIRDIGPQDRDWFLQAEKEFYAPPAVAHAIPAANAERTFAQLMEKSPFARCFIAAGADGKPCAYLLCAVTWSNEAGGICVWLEELFVEREKRGQGIGSALLKAAQAAWPDAARFRLEVTESNTRAAALYRSLGFDWLEYRQMVRDIPSAPQP